MNSEKKAECEKMVTYYTTIQFWLKPSEITQKK